MATGERWRLGRRPELDGVRGLAILLVIGAHAGLIPGSQFHGGVGVILFFALSGYLITGLLLAELDRAESIDLVAFYIRRAARLLPALGVMLVLLGCLWFWPDWYLRDALLSAFYVSNLVAANGYDLGPLGHTWSLAIEEQFYLLWPLAVVLLASRRRTLVAATAAVLALSVAARLTAESFDVVKFGTHTNAYALLAGCLLALAGARFGRWAGTLAALGLLLVPFLSIDWFAPATVLAAGLAVLLLGASQSLSWLSLPVLRFFGSVSYGWYLWHLPLMHLGWDDYPMQRPAMALLSLGIAVLSLRYVEDPIRRAAATWLAERRSRQAINSTAILG